jgi:hypothetical protein
MASRTVANEQSGDLVAQDLVRSSHHHPGSNE